MVVSVLVLVWVFIVVVVFNSLLFLIGVNVFFV